MIKVGDIYRFKSDDAPASLGKLWYNANCEVKKIDFSQGKFPYLCRIWGRNGFPFNRWVSADALYLYTNCPNLDITIPKIIMKYSFCVEG